MTPAGPVRVKICGLTCPEDVRAAADAGAAYVGFVFFAKSPRHVDHETASALAALVIGVLSLRTSGVYFIMITLAFAQMLYFLGISLEEFGGDDGMPTVVRIVDPQGAVNRLEFTSWAPADRTPTGGWLPAVPAGFERAGDVE